MTFLLILPKIPIEEQTPKASALIVVGNNSDMYTYKIPQAAVIRNLTH